MLKLWLSKFQDASWSRFHSARAERSTAMREHLILCRREPGPAAAHGWLLLSRLAGVEEVVDVGDALVAAWAGMEKRLDQPGDLPDVTITNAALEFLTDDPFEIPGVSEQWSRHGAHVVCPEGIDEHMPGNFVGLSSRGGRMTAPQHVSTRKHLLAWVGEASPVATPDVFERFRVKDVPELRFRPDLRAVDISEAARCERDKRAEAVRKAAEHQESREVDRLADVKRNGVHSPYFAELFGSMNIVEFQRLQDEWHPRPDAETRAKIEAERADEIAEAKALDHDPQERARRVRESVGRMIGEVA